MPKFMTYQRPRPLNQAKRGGGGKPPFGPVASRKRGPKPPPGSTGPGPLPPPPKGPFKPK